MSAIRWEMLIPVVSILLPLGLALLVGRFVLVGAVRLIRREWAREEPPQA